MTIQLVAGHELSRESSNRSSRSGSKKRSRFVCYLFFCVKNSMSVVCAEFYQKELKP